MKRGMDIYEKKRIKIQRFLSAALSMVFLMSFPHTAAFGEAVSLEKEDVPVEISSIALEFLEASARNSFLYESNDIEGYFSTTAEVSIDTFAVEDQLEAEVEAAEQQRKLERDPEVLETQRKMGLKVSVAEEYEEIGINHMMKTSLLDGEELDFDPQQYWLDKTEFSKQVRMDGEIKRNNFSLDYSVLNSEIRGDKAYLHIYEGASFQYPELDEPSFIGSEYHVFLARESGQWKVLQVIDRYDTDSFDAFYAEVNYDLSLALETYQDNSDNGQPGETLEFAAIEPRGFQNGINYSGTYAKNYSDTYVSSGDPFGTKCYNPRFTSYEPNDCQNYVSQAIWAGFGGNDVSYAISNKSRPMDNKGVDNKTRWYGNPTSDWAWTSCSYFRDYLCTSVEQGSSAKADYMTGSISDLAADKSFSTTPAVGTILHLDLKRVGDYAHAVIVSRATGTSRDQVYVNAHTDNAKNMRLSDMFHSSGAAKIIKPSMFYAYDACSHEYTINPKGQGTDASCNKCYATRFNIRTFWTSAIQTGSTINVGGQAGIRCFRMAICVKDPNGNATWFEATNTSSITKSYKFTKTGLYEVSVSARELDPYYYKGSVSETKIYHIRTY